MAENQNYNPEYGINMNNRKHKLQAREQAIRNHENEVEKQNDMIRKKQIKERNLRIQGKSKYGSNNEPIKVARTNNNVTYKDNKKRKVIKNDFNLKMKKLVNKLKKIGITIIFIGICIAAILSTKNPISAEFKSSIMEFNGQIKNMEVQGYDTKVEKLYDDYYDAIELTDWENPSLEIDKYAETHTQAETIKYVSSFNGLNMEKIEAIGDCGDYKVIREKNKLKEYRKNNMDIVQNNKQNKTR